MCPALRYCCQNLSQSVCKKYKNVLIGVPNKVSGVDLFLCCIILIWVKVLFSAIAWLDWWS